MDELELNMNEEELDLILSIFYDKEIIKIRTEALERLDSLYKEYKKIKKREANGSKPKLIIEELNSLKRELTKNDDHVAQLIKEIPDILDGVNIPQKKDAMEIVKLAEEFERGYNGLLQKKFSRIYKLFSDC